ncbi:hypothetical protein GIB67_030826 [Kingdonia uniflora]|uniref:Amine oxidase n=1 Tax=Kingdonia uniflora TaxID=39325 RepID=A0A7J7L3A9_9MAGN|nr:hypothetical protein GIB67_030826 [Kingdonia uniflora]
MSILTGRERINEILSGPNQIAYDSLRMNKDAFVSLCGYFKARGWVIGFTMPPKNKKTQQEVTGDPSQDTPKDAKQLNGEMLYTYLILCKRELDTSKDAGSGLSKASWTKIREERTGNGFNAETRTFHLLPEEWDALIKINENVSTFRKGGLLHEELMESIFAIRVATGKYATGPVRDDFIDTATSDVAADLNMEDENVPTEQADFIEDTTNTYFNDHHFGPFQAEHSFSQTEQYTPNHFGQSAPQPMQSASQSENSRRSGKNKQKVEDTLDKLDQLIEVIKTQGEREGLAKQDTREKKLSEVLIFFKKCTFWGIGMCFIEVELLDPDKHIVALADAYFFPPFQPSLFPETKSSLPRKLPPRRARLVVYNRRSNETSIWVIELIEEYDSTRGSHHKGKLVSSKVVRDVQPPIDGAEYVEIEAVVKKYPPFREVMKKRGINDMDLVMVDPWCSGYYSEADAPFRRLAKPLFFCKTKSNSPMENGYSRPIEGIYALVDMQKMEIIEFEDRKLIPLPPADPLRNYTSGETRGRGCKDRTDVKPLQIIQREGPSFRVNGHFVEWQKWSFRIGFSPREGLVIYSVAYNDGSRGLRPIAHRLSFVEMVVPYGDPDEPHYTKNAFDAGEDGLGKNANSLTKWPTTIMDSTGTFIRHVDGKIEAEVKLTGILSIGGLQGKKANKYGTTIASGIYAPIHQHFFTARMDMSVDCKPGEKCNQVVEVNAKVEELARNNFHDNAFYAEEKVLKSEMQAMRDCNSLFARHWIVRNTRTVNRTGEPTGYKLVPDSNCLPLAGADAKFLRRAAFLKHNLWVTTYAHADMYPGGDFPKQNPRIGEGLTAWVKQDRSLEEADIVLWYIPFTFMLYAHLQDTFICTYLELYMFLDLKTGLSCLWSTLVLCLCHTGSLTAPLPWMSRQMLPKQILKKSSVFETVASPYSLHFESNAELIRTKYAFSAINPR